jgi:O-methyltransferase/aklanonic acid methyltransferase
VSETDSSRIVGLFSRAASTYDRVGPRQFSFFAERLVEFVQIAAGSDVLDVATGTGAVLLAAERRSGTRGRLVGVDVTPAMLSRAAAEVEARGVRNVELLQMDGERLAFADGSFDVVLCSFGLQALVDKRAALAGFGRVLKPCGRLGVVFPLGWFADSDVRWSWLPEVLRSFEVPSWGNDYGPDDLALAVRAAGFVAVEAVEETCPLDFADENEWWSWLWSHGTRSLFEAVPPDRLTNLREALFEGLRGCAGADGVIHGSMSAVLLRATKPRG